VHSFDNQRLTSRRFREGHPMQYNPTSAVDSYARVQAFLAQWVKP
jgi:dienelactone hydrolase